MRRGDLTNYLPNYNDADIRNYVNDTLRWYQRVQGLRYFGHVEHYLKAYVGDHSSKNLSDRGGFFLLSPFSKPAFDELVTKRLNIPHAWYMDAAKSERFRKLLLAHPERRIYLVAAPIHKSYFQSMSGLEKADAWLAQLSDIPNLKVIDLSRVDYPDSLYLNTSHLNYLGAKRFSTELRSILQQTDSVFRP
jgi:hypothetical protein